MRAIRIYQTGEFQIGQELELSAQAGQHVAIVLRRNVGDKLTLFNGENKEFECQIIKIKKKQIFVVINTMLSVSRESSLKIHLGQAISKGDRMDWVMQKATELGITTITP